MSSLARISYAKSVRILSSTAVKKMLQINNAKKARTVKLRIFSESEHQAKLVPTSAPMVPIFLRFLGIDIEQHPSRLKPITTGLLARIDALVGDEDIDIDAPLLPEDDD